MVRQKPAKLPFPSSNLGATYQTYRILQVLFLVATPIGNLSDISERALATLRQSDYILCEDTRHSRPLLQRFAIDKPLYSYHKHNEALRTQQVIEDLRAGKRISLISDAGTPGISDPGHYLVQACHEAQLQVVPIPGPCAAIAALSASPLPNERFQFVGFLPKADGELKKFLRDALCYLGTTVCYESPQRLVKTLKALNKLAPNAPVAVCRELTKMHEELRFNTASRLFEYYSQNPPKGEIVLLLGSYPIEQSEEERELSKQDAIKAAAKLLGMSKKDLYRLIHCD